MRKFLPFAYFENKIVPFREAKISIATHALHYGTAAFGGIRGIVDPQEPGQILLFRLQKHCKRLSDSAQLLQYKLSAGEIEERIVEFVIKNNPSTSFYIRPLIYTSELDIIPRLHDIENNFLIYGLELGEYLSCNDISCRISSWYRQEDRSLPLRGKITGAYITSALAKAEAVDSGFNEAIMLNSLGKVSEASGMNIFIIRNGILITPGVEQDILEGITRLSILEIAKTLKIKTLERPIDKSELFLAEEAFLCGTAASILPISRIENYALPKEQPISNLLKQKLKEIAENRDSEFEDWVYKIQIN